MRIYISRVNTPLSVHTGCAGRRKLLRIWGIHWQSTLWARRHRPGAVMPFPEITDWSEGGSFIPSDFKLEHNWSRLGVQHSQNWEPRYLWRFSVIQVMVFVARFVVGNWTRWSPAAYELLSPGTWKLFMKMLHRCLTWAPLSSLTMWNKRGQTAQQVALH